MSESRGTATPSFARSAIFGRTTSSPLLRCWVSTGIESCPPRSWGPPISAYWSQVRVSSSRSSPAIPSTLSVPRQTDSSFGRKGSSDQLHTKECLMKETSKVHKIAFVGDHLPRKCGIATFTSDLLGAVAEAHPQSQCFCVSVNDIKEGYEYPEVVRFEIDEQDLSSYLRAADFLNISNVDIVCLQHEFGIYGGPAGGHILAFLRELRMPVVTTLHTVLLEPRPDQRRVMDGLISLSARLVVMAERGRTMLQDIYRVSPSKIDLIPHGIPDVGFVDPTFFKDQFGVEGRVVLLTFGLLSPGKGIEVVLNALPQILTEFPDVVYIVLGAT